METSRDRGNSHGLKEAPLGRTSAIAILVIVLAYGPGRPPEVVPGKTWYPAKQEAP